MEDFEPTEAQLERIESFREKLDSKTSPYSTVTAEDTINYLLDIATEIDDPSPLEKPSSIETAMGRTSKPFPRTKLRGQLEERRISQSDPNEAEEMDLYTIATEFDIEGRSSMKKAELINAILDTAERQYTNPFASVDIDFDNIVELDAQSDVSDAENISDENVEDKITKTDEDDDHSEDNSPDDDSGQLDAMLNLMEAHDDKWWLGDGEARYSVELPDGSVESARTKDDVRAILFKNY